MLIFTWMFFLGDMSSPKRIEKVNVNLGTGAAVTTFPLNFGPDGAGYGSFYRTASGVSVSFFGGAWQFSRLRWKRFVSIFER